MGVLVVGAIHHDVIVDAPSLPREDETLVGSGVRYAFGGKGGNQAVAAARMAKDETLAVSMAACLGVDQAADEALQTLTAGGVNTGHIQRVEGPSGMSVALSLPGGGYGAVIVSASNLQLDANAIDLDSGTRVLVLQNELPEAINLAMAQKAKHVGTQVVLNAAPARPLPATLASLVDVLVVNRVEAADYARQNSADDVIGVIDELRKHVSGDIIVTLGGDGLWVAQRSRAANHISAHDVSVISTHGAGDMFVGALAIELADGQSLEQAATFANAAAALHVQSTVEERSIISREMVETLL